MHPELTAKLTKAYPLLMHQGDDGYSYSNFGLQCDSGWYPLLFEIFGLLDDLQKATGKAVGLSDVKQKFGTLRIYGNYQLPTTEEIMIEQVFELVSESVCEVCGEPGRRDDIRGYVVTRCEKHMRRLELQQAVKIEKQVVQKFSNYERQGLDTDGIVFVISEGVENDDGACELTIFHFPERLTSLVNLRGQLECYSFLGDVEQAKKIVKEHARGRRLTGVSDSSAVASAALNDE